MACLQVVEKVCFQRKAGFYIYDKVKNMYHKMPWRDIKSMRNIAAHNYGELDIEVLWETVTNDIPELKAYCEDIIAGKE